MPVVGNARRVRAGPFVVAPLLIFIFSIKLNLLPVALWESPWHMILPPIALGSLLRRKKLRRRAKEC